MSRGISEAYVAVSAITFEFATIWLVAWMSAAIMSASNGGQAYLFC